MKRDELVRGPEWELPVLARLRKRARVERISFVAAGGLLAAGASVLGFGEPIAVFAAGALGMIAGRLALRRRARALAAIGGSAERVHELAARGDGELVRVHGRIEGLAGEPLDEPGVVWRRVVTWARAPDPHRVEERASDFYVVDEEGQRCWVDVSDARLVTGETMVGSRELRIGDEIDVIGRKDRRVDPRGTTHLRDAPELTMLRAGPSQPLLVMVLPTPAATALVARSRV